MKIFFMWHYSSVVHIPGLAPFKKKGEPERAKLLRLYVVYLLAFPIILLVWKVKNDLNDFWLICQNKFSSIFRSINCFIFDKMVFFLFFMYIEFTFLNWLKQWFSVNVFNAINTHRNTHKIITNFKHLCLGQPVRQPSPRVVYNHKICI